MSWQKNLQILKAVQLRSASLRKRIKNEEKWSEFQKPVGWEKRTEYSNKGPKFPNLIFKKLTYTSKKLDEFQGA